ncbi:MAG: HD domain-containing protein [Negativicutes bacterium]|nr:HD domain-containing protein [Negativicutes bacterium]
MSICVGDIKTMAKGQPIRGVYLLSGFEIRSGGQNGRYGSARLSDRSGKIEARIWELPDDPAWLSEMPVVFIEGEYCPYQGVPQVRISRLAAVPDEQLKAGMLSSLVRVSSHDPRVMWGELTGLVESMGDQRVRAFCDRLIFDDEEVCGRLRVWPAAVAFHHDYVGGLLQHTWEMARMADALAKTAPDINRDLLLAMVCMHDIGKIHEIEVDRLGGPAGFSRQGRLLGHIYIGMAMVDRCGRRYDLDPEVGLALQHAILSHHGSREFGSPLPPKIKEAQILHFLDNMSARREIFATELASVRPGTFSPWVKSIQSEIYLPDFPSGDDQ